MSAQKLSSRIVARSTSAETALLVPFALLFLFFIVGPALLSFPFASGPVPDVGDLVDLATPFVLLPFYYVMLRRSTADGARFHILPERVLVLVFFLSAILFTQGQGMHLSANSIGHFLKEDGGTAAEGITYFYDEILSHYFVWAGVLGLALVISLAGIRSAAEAGRRGSSLPAVVAALIYGLTFAMAAVEGQTVPMGLPVSMLLAGILVLCRRRHCAVDTPFATFFGVGHGFAVLLLIGWGLYFRGFPEFSAVGLLR